MSVVTPKTSIKLVLVFPVERLVSAIMEASSEKVKCLLVDVVNETKSCRQ